MFVIEDVFAILLLIAVGVWAMLSSWRWVRILIASLYLFVLVDGVMSYEPAARSAVSRHKRGRKSLRMAFQRCFRTSAYFVHTFSSREPDCSPWRLKANELVSSCSNRTLTLASRSKGLLENFSSRITFWQLRRIRTPSTES
jgi:hypothetical protein